MELIIVTGYVGSSELTEIEGRNAGQVTKVLNFSLAAHKGAKEARTTTWYRATIYGERAEKLADSITEGVQLLVHGEPSVQAYMGRGGDKEGKPQASMNIRVDRVEFIGSRKRDDATDSE